jgi:hypothetical protein
VTIETTLLILESVLLAATIILLMYSIREGKRRDVLLSEIGRATKILTRQEYFLTVVDAMMDAKNEVVGSITGRLPTGDDHKRIKNIIDEIDKLIRKRTRVKYLIPKFPDRLNVGHLYSKAGAEIRYSSYLMVQDVRYLVVDHRLVVLGIPESTGDREATKKGYMIPSEGLAAMLEENFFKCWDNSIGYEDYVRELIKETGASPKMLARELGVDEKELERIVSQ